MQDILFEISFSCTLIVLQIKLISKFVHQGSFFNQGSTCAVYKPSNK